MKILLYIKKYKLAAVIIAILLMLQSITSFIVPYISSSIIDVGIQQGGIEYATPVSLSIDTYNNIKKLVNFTPELENSYNYNDDCWTLNEYGEKHKKELEIEIKGPLSYLYENDNKQISDVSFDTYIKNNSDDIIKQKSINATKKEMLKNDVDTTNIQMSYLFYQGMTLLLITIFIILISFSTNALTTIISSKIAKEKRQEVFNSIIRFNSSDINNFNESTLITRCTNDIQNAQAFCTMLLGIILYAPICIIVGMYFTITTAIQLSWILILVSIGIIVSAIVFRNFVIKYFRLTQKLVDKVNANIVEIISGIYVNRTFNKQKFTEEKFDKQSSQLYKYQLITGRVIAVITPILGLGAAFVSIFIIFLGGFYINTGEIQVGQIIAFTSYAGILISAFTDLGRFIGKIPQASVTYSRIESVINYNKNKDNKNNHKLQLKEVLNADNNVIKLNNVDFGYDNSKNLALNNINLEIKEGETIGIIGSVGSGKSTLLKLIIGFYSPKKGKILLNNTDIKNIELSTYKSLFAYSPQQSFLFSGTVHDNVSYGIKDIPEQEKKQIIEESIKDSCADDFIFNKNTKGLNKKISQDSSNISGGQRQRLSIARALATNNPIFVFDDSYSSLDYKIEQKLRNTISKKYKNKTKIIVSSRISSIMDADKIIVLDEGKIIGQGKHKDLLSNNEEYIKIAKAQLDNYDENKKWES